MEIFPTQNPWIGLSGIWPWEMVEKFRLKKHDD